MDIFQRLGIPQNRFLVTPEQLARLNQFFRNRYARPVTMLTRAELRNRLNEIGNFVANEMTLFHLSPQLSHFLDREFHRTLDELNRRASQQWDEGYESETGGKLPLVNSRPLKLPPTAAPVPTSKPPPTYGYGYIAPIRPAPGTNPVGLLDKRYNVTVSPDYYEYKIPPPPGPKLGDTPQKYFDRIEKIGYIVQPAMKQYFNNAYKDMVLNFADQQKNMLDVAQHERDTQKALSALQTFETIAGYVVKLIPDSQLYSSIISGLQQVQKAFNKYGPEPTWKKYDYSASHMNELHQEDVAAFFKNIDLYDCYNKLKQELKGPNWKQWLTHK